MEESQRSHSLQTEGSQMKLGTELKKEPFTKKRGGQNPPQAVPILDLPRSTREAKENLNEHLQGLSQGHEVDFRATSIAERLLRHSEGQRVLDAGCGSGFLSLELLRRGKDVTPIDHEEEMVQLTNQTLAQNGFDETAQVHSLDQLDRLGSESFDEIYCCDVIEHVEDDQAAMAQLKSLIKPGGQLILTVPAWPFLYGERDRRMHHFRRYSRKALATLFERTGFQIEHLRWWNLSGFLLNTFVIKLFRIQPSEKFRYGKRTLQKRIVNRILHAWFHVIENHVPVPFGLTLIVVARKSS